MAGKRNPHAELDKVLGAVNQSMGGKSVIRSAAEMKTCFDLRRPTGIDTLDPKIGGGWIAGCINEVTGKARVGKTVQFNLAVAENQAIYGEESRVCVVSFGYPWDLAFMRKCGATVQMSDDDIDKLEKSYGTKMDPEVRESYKRSIGRVDVIAFGDRIDEAAKNPAGVILETIVQLVRHKAPYQIIILDEIGAHESKALAAMSLDAREALADADADADEEDESKPKAASNVRKKAKEPRRPVADTALLMDLFTKKLYAAYNLSSHDSPNETTILTTAQMRTDIKPGRSYDKPVGGNALTYATALELRLKFGDEVMEKGPEGKLVIAGKQVLFEIVRAKHGCHEGYAGSYTWYYGHGINKEEELAKAASECGIVRREGKDRSVWVYGEGETEIRAHGIKGFAFALSQADPGVRAAIRTAIKGHYGLLSVRHR